MSTDRRWMVASPRPRAAARLRAGPRWTEESRACNDQLPLTPAAGCGSPTAEPGCRAGTCRPTRPGRGGSQQPGTRPCSGCPMHTAIHQVGPLLDNANANLDWGNDNNMSRAPLRSWAAGPLPERFNHDMSAPNHTQAPGSSDRTKDRNQPANRVRSTLVDGIRHLSHTVRGAASHRRTDRRGSRHRPVVHCRKLASSMPMIT